MNKLKFNALTTERLYLRSLKETDAQAHLDYASDSKNFPFADMNEMKSINEVTDYFKKMKKGVAKGDWLFWVIAHKETDKALGTLSLWNIDFKAGTGEFGFGIYPDGRGLAYMAEALNAAVNYCFESLDMTALQGWTSSQNLAAIKTLTHCNFKYIKTEIEDAYSHNEEIEYHVYQIDQ